MLIFQQSDEDLMGLVVLGESGTFEELVRRYQNRLLAVAYRSLRAHATAEDIVQDTLTAVWQERFSFDKSIAKFSTWVYNILRNQIDKYLRDSQKMRQMISLSSVEEDKDILAISPVWFEHLPENRLVKLKEIVLRYLTGEEQQLYHLKEEEGLSYEEISRIPPFKGVKIATLKKRRQYYKDKIIEALEIEKYNK